MQQIEDLKIIENGKELNIKKMSDEEIVSRMVKCNDEIAKLLKQLEQPYQGKNKEVEISAEDCEFA